MTNYQPKILIICDGYPNKKNFLTGVFVKEQLDCLKEQHQEFGFDLYYNPYFRIFSKTLEKKSKFWNIIKWTMQLVCFLPYLFKRYDLVHTHRFFLPVLNGTIYKFIHRVPLVVTSHGIVQIRKRYKSKQTKRLFNYCDLIFAVNAEMKNEFIKNFNLPKENVVVRSCGLNFSEFDKILSKETDYNKKSTDNITLGFIGDYSENKNPFFFIRCIEALYENYSINGIMIGGGQKIREVQQYINEHKLPIEVKATLPHSEIIANYTKFDVLIFPSFSETFGIVGIEALYSSVPVIASAVGGKLDYIQNGFNGLLFENSNLDDLILKTETLLQNPDMLDRMKLKAKESVSAYANEVVVNDIAIQYKRLLEM